MEEQTVAVDDVVAAPIRVVEGAEIIVAVSPSYLSWAFRDKHDQPSINRLWTDAADETLSLLDHLKGINARIVYEEKQRCSACGYGFEVDEATGLTACCGRATAPASGVSK